MALPIGFEPITPGREPGTEDRSARLPRSLMSFSPRQKDVALLGDSATGPGRDMTGLMSERRKRRSGRDMVNPGTSQVGAVVE